MRGAMPDEVQRHPMAERADLTVGHVARLLVDHALCIFRTAPISLLNGGQEGSCTAMDPGLTTDEHEH